MRRCSPGTAALAGDRYRPILPQRSHGVLSRDASRERRGLASTDSGGNDVVGHGIECRDKVGTVCKRDDGRVPRITQGRKAMGLGVFTAAELTVMRRLIKSERDVRIAKDAPRTFRERGSLGQIVQRELQWMRRIQLRSAGLDFLDCLDGFKERCHLLVPRLAHKSVEGQRRKAGQKRYHGQRQ